MKRKLLFIFALLCMVAQGAWAETVDLSTITKSYVAQDGDVLTGTFNTNILTQLNPVKISIADGASITLRDATILGIDEFKDKENEPDEHFYEYKVARSECSDFKDHVSKVYNYYKSSDFMQFPLDKNTKRLRPITKERERFVKENWNYLKAQNVKKANYICTDIYDYPENKASVSQKKILAAQLEKHVLLNNEVSVLNAFPLFLYEYFK